jgi:dipeptidyl aminopeptidase/acylaminoacyl peptidase
MAGAFTGGWAAAPGLVAYRVGTGHQRQLTWVDRSGTALGTVGAPDGTLRNPRLSPDGRRVVAERVVQGNIDLWLLDGARTSRLTFDPAGDIFPLWSPDGTRIVFTSARSGNLDLYQKRTNGTGGEERLIASGQPQPLVPMSWSPDGRFLLYINNDPQTNADLWVAPMAGDLTPWVFLKTPFREAYGSFSPDGRWVAYHSNESGRNEVYVRPFVPPMDHAGAAASAPATTGGQWQVSTEGGIHPVWRRDGQALYYLSPAGEMVAAPITVVGATLESGAPVMLFPTRVLGGGVDAQQGRQYDVARDGPFSSTRNCPATPRRSRSSNIGIPRSSGSRHATGRPRTSPTGLHVWDWPPAWDRADRDVDAWRQGAPSRRQSRVIIPSCTNWCSWSKRLPKADSPLERWVLRCSRRPTPWTRFARPFATRCTATSTPAKSLACCGCTS